MEEYVTELQVNENPVELNHFAAQFLARTVIGAASSLKGVDNIGDLRIYYCKEDLQLTVNGKNIPLSQFPLKIIISTLKGLLSSLKGVGPIDSFNISVHP